jgi:transposase
MSTPKKELSIEKKEIILQLCRNGMKQTEVARALWIPTPTICRDGMKQTEVVRALGIPHLTICRFLKRYRESGSLENKRRSGRPKQITDRGVRVLTRVLRGDRMASLVDITNNFNNNSQIGVYKRTIQRCLHRCDFRKPGIRKNMGV